MKKFNCIVAGICLSASLASAETIEWSAGSLGGGWYTMSAGIAKIITSENPDIKIKVVPGGGTANPSKIQKNRSQIAMGLDTVSYLAVNAKGMYGKKHDKVSLIGQGLSDQILHVVRSKDAKYTNIADLLTKGEDKRIAINKVGSSDELVFRWIMEYYNTSYADLKKRGFKVVHGSYSEVASQFKDGLVEYAVVKLGVPGAAVIDMLLSRDGEVTTLPADLMSSLKKNWGYNSGTIKKDTYKGQTSDAVTGNMSTALIASTDLSTNTVYKITKAICENEDKLESIHSSMKFFSCKTATVDASIPVHPGAAKYYKEMGYIK